MKQIITKEELSTLSADKINQPINQAFKYDEVSWQKKNNIRVHYKDRAKGLHKVLYKCMSCGTEYEMDSASDKLWCNRCRSQWTMSKLGELLPSKAGEAQIHIPDWYEWQRKDVRRQIEAGTYSMTSE